MKKHIRECLKLKKTFKNRSTDAYHLTKVKHVMFQY